MVPTKSKEELVRYSLDRGQLYLKSFLGHELFDARKISTQGQGQLANQMAHQAKGKAKAIKESSKKTGNKWNVPQNPKAEIPCKLEKSKNSKFDYWVVVPNLWTKAKTVRVPLKSHKALNQSLKEGWQISKWACLKEGNTIMVFVSRKKEKPKIKTECLGVDVGLKHSFSDSHGYLANGLGKKIKKTKHRQSERLQQGHKKNRNSVKYKSSVKNTLDRNAKKIIRNAKFLGKNIAVENPVTIGQISRGSLQGWAGAYLARRLQVLGMEESVSVIFVNPWKTSKTCSSCEEKDRVIRVKNNFDCEACGLHLNADINAAKNIARNGTVIASKIILKLNQAPKRSFV